MLTLQRSKFWRTSDRRGNRVLISLACMNIALYFFTYFFYRTINARRAKVWDAWTPKVRPSHQVYRLRGSFRPIATARIFGYYQRWRQSEVKLQVCVLGGLFVGLQIAQIAQYLHSSPANHNEKQHVYHLDTLANTAYMSSVSRVQGLSAAGMQNYEVNISGAG